ncbi:hypothetical protein OHB56_20280 [Streptomyces sp. NBC_01635]|uniref:hypothetical protein n=1 Tax=Streptomyces sp. NBC_01635 TaxID=2975904 RepID=UPI0038660E82|nr:hypothetical protein OHB56_20280 [Streptomyces sp. NBC_01635]
MTTDTNTDTSPEVAQADAEAREAGDLLAALEERVRDGDDKITPQQLTEQRELGRFARLRAEAARRKAERAAERAAEEQRQQHHRQALALLADQGDPQRLTDAYRAALTAIVEFLAVSDGFDDAVSEAVALLKKAQAPQARGEEYGTPKVPAWVDDYGHQLVAFGREDMRAANGAGNRLAVLLEDADTARRKQNRAEGRDAARGVRTSQSAPAFMNAPITDQARGARHGLRPRLDQLAAAEEGEAA